MEITLTKPTEEFVQQQIAKGFQNASVVLEVACRRWMMEEDEQYETEEWRQHVRAKLDEAARGSFRRVEDGDIAAMLDRIRRDVGLTR